MKIVKKNVAKVRIKKVTTTLEKEMRMYWLAYNVALESDVLELLERLNIQAYTSWEEVRGCGRSGPHLNDEVWPAVNALYMFIAPAEAQISLIAEVAQIRNQFPGEGIKLIVQPCLGIY